MNPIYATARALNQPLVKEGMKNLFSVVTFAFGVRAIHHLTKIGSDQSDQSFSSERVNDLGGIEFANAMVILAAKVSLVLSAAVSRPGVGMISTLAGFAFSTQQLERAFGPNTIFAINPWHPRHVVSIAAVILGFPAAIQGAYKGVRWIQSKIQGTTTSELHADQLSDPTVRLMTIFNTIFSRPTLHIVNQLLHP